MIGKELKKRILSSIILLPLSLFFIISGSYMLMFFTLICFFVSCYEWHMMSKKKTYKFYGFIFLIFSFYTFYKLSLELSLVFIVISICISTDIGGYVFGKIFKGPKLIKISPNKTYSGMFGSFILSMIAAMIFSEYQYYISLYDGLLDIKKNNLYYILIILLISAVSQIGDLIISYFKRKAKLKDTGKIIPGHGGLLDRIDGMIFAFPYTFILMKII
jgi:phosphatidate cytidylyltransferase